MPWSQLAQAKEMTYFIKASENIDENGPAIVKNLFKFSSDDRLVKHLAKISKLECVGHNILDLNSTGHLVKQMLMMPEKVGAQTHLIGKK